MADSSPSRFADVCGEDRDCERAADPVEGIQDAANAADDRSSTCIHELHCLRIPTLATCRISTETSCLGRRMSRNFPSPTSKPPVRSLCGLNWMRRALGTVMSWSCPTTAISRTASSSPPTTRGEQMKLRWRDFAPEWNPWRRSSSTRETLSAGPALMASRPRLPVGSRSFDRLTTRSVVTPRAQGECVSGAVFTGSTSSEMSWLRASARKSVSASTPISSASSAAPIHTTARRDTSRPRTSWVMSVSWTPPQRDASVQAQ